MCRFFESRPPRRYDDNLGSAWAEGSTREVEAVTASASSSFVGSSSPVLGPGKGLTSGRELRSRP